MGEIGERWEKSSQAGSCHNEERIVVSVRLRPLNDKERGRNDASDWECISEDTVIFRNNLPVPERSVFPTSYTFDRVFRHDSSTKQVYEEAAKEVALSVVGGINSSIFAYGQTSSGKTYTMTGVTEYAVADIYDYVQRHKERDFILKFSAMEIYNEAVRDLLSSDTTPRRLLDDPERGTVVDKLTEETLRDWNHVQELLSLCEAQRQIGETSLNETSSRSHQIIRLSIESSPREFLGKDNSGTLAASVDFIDLAGSERASQAHSAGTRLKEGCHINRSLLTLGTVVRKLSKGRNGHIPYRDSKLTRILQCSLGGNARTAIICTISPARTHVEQSRNTLLFASCAKEVATNAQVNVVMSDKVLVKHLQRELARLESELKGPTLVSTPSDSTALLIEKDLQIEKMQREIKELIQQRDLAQSRLVDLVEVVGDDQTPRHWSAYNERPRCYATNSWEDDHSTSTSSGVGDHHSIDTGVTKFNRSWYSNEHSGSNVDDPYLHVPENPEEQSLSNGDSPRHSVSSTKFVRSDHCQVWEEETTQNTEEDFEEDCKEVRCIEMEEPSINRKVQSNTFEDPEKCEEVVPMVETSNEDRTDQELVSYPKKEDKDFKHVDSGLTYGALEQKLQDVQKTIDSLVNPFPGQPSPWSPTANSSSTRGLKFVRSRSCKEILLSSTSSPWFQKAEQYERSPNVFEKYVPERSEGFERNFSVISRGTSVQGLSREDSQTSEHSVSTDELKAHNIKSSAEEDITSIRTFVAGLKEMAKLQYEKHLVDEKEKVQEKENIQEEEEEEEEEEEKEKEKENVQEEEKEENVHEEEKEKENVQEEDKEGEEEEEEVQETKPKVDESRRSVKDVGLDPVEDSFESPSSWTLEFERLQREIVELWATCNISLVHRSYFFLLFKGDPSDSIYLEVELRRLSFLKDNISKGNLRKLTMEGGQDLSPDSSKKALRREREMLSKQLQKRFSEEERLNLYRKWGIQLDTKQRKQQLAQLLWSNTKDMNHIIDSAALVAKLVGLLEPGQAPKEMFGLSFSPRYTARRSYSWKSMSSLM